MPSRHGKCIGAEVGHGAQKRRECRDDRALTPSALLCDLTLT